MSDSDEQLKVALAACARLDAENARFRSILAAHGLLPKPVEEHPVVNSLEVTSFEANLAEKLSDPVFHADVAPLLALNANAEVQFDVVRAAESVHDSFLSQLSGEPWKGLSITTLCIDTCF